MFSIKVRKGGFMPSKFPFSRYRGNCGTQKKARVLSPSKNARSFVGSCDNSTSTTGKIIYHTSKTILSELVFLAKKQWCA